MGWQNSVGLQLTEESLTKVAVHGFLMTCKGADGAMTWKQGSIANIQKRTLMSFPLNAWTAQKL